jgi:hypothetical protein
MTAKTPPTLALERLTRVKRLRAALYSALHDATAEAYPRTFLESLKVGIDQADKDFAHWASRAGLSASTNVVAFDLRGLS